MQQLLGQRRKRCAQELAIARLDIGILVREANIGVRIEPPQHLATLGRQLAAVMDGLTASADAAAGARHDLNEVIAHTAVANRVEQAGGVAQPVRHGDAHLGAIDIGDGFLPAVQATHVGKEIGVGVLARHQVIGRAHGGLHHAARGAKDHARARAETQRRVERLLGKRVHAHVARADHTHHLAHRQRNVYVGRAALAHHTRQRALGLLGRARHHGHHEHALGLHTQHLGVVRLGNSAEHLLRRLGRGQAVDKLRIARLHKAHPARAAARKHGPAAAIALTLSGGAQALEQLGALLHNGEVGREIGIEHVLKAHTAQRAGQALDGSLLARNTELLAPGATHGRRNLHQHDLVGISESIEHGLGVVALAQCARRAMRNALAARDAIGLADRRAPAGTHGGMRGAVGQVPNPQALHALAHLDAAHALNALVVFADDGKIEVPALARQMPLIRQIENAQVVGDGLQVAVAAAHAARALRIVLGQQQLHVGATGLAGLGAVGVDHHAVEHVVVAGGNQLVAALNLDHAHAAAADLV